MTEPFRSLEITLILLLLAATLNGAGIELTGIGAMAAAMAGSHRAVADDWSAMYWNPGGLAFTKGWSSGVSLNYVMPRASFRFGESHYAALYGSKPSFSVSDQAVHDAEPLNFVAPSAGVSYSSGKLAFGLGVWAPLALGTRWDLLTPERITAYNARYPRYEYEIDIKVIDVHPTVAYRISDKLAVGLGLSALIAEFGIRQPAFLQNPFLYDQNLRQLLQTLSNPEQQALLEKMGNSPFDHLINDIMLSSSGSGYGANLGVLYKPSPNWSIGMTAQASSALSLSGDYRQTTYFADDADYQRLTQFYSDTLFSKLYRGKLISEQQFLMLSKYYSGEVFPLVDTGARVRLALPNKYGLGISYRGFKDLMLAADITYSQWSVWDVIEIQAADGTHLSQLSLNWQDALKVGAGFEWRTKGVILRGGAATENRAATDGAVSPAIPDINRRLNLNAGICVPLGPVMLSLVYERLIIADRQIKEWQYDEMTVAQNIAGHYTLQVNSLMLGIDYRF